MIESIYSILYGQKVTEEEVNKILPNLKDVDMKLESSAFSPSKKHLDSISKEDITVNMFDNAPPLHEEGILYRIKKKDGNVEIRINQKGHYPFCKKDGSSYNVPYQVNILIKGREKDLNDSLNELGKIAIETAISSVNIHREVLEETMKKYSEIKN